MISRELATLDPVRVLKKSEIPKKMEFLMVFQRFFKENGSKFANLLPII